ncbi:helix-turn-helix domain-containing protein, partial [Blautia coccoides]|uniref:helix-turn-helix domain-containing protein n=1 Tax=Blautia producta TaxID=33035 RepID=UPI00210CA11E
MEGFLLNDTDWNTDLKEKRLAYGVSQNKLAVAAGITRQYLGKIESGGAAPSEEIKENLLQALERYNPETPFTMLFDYVRIRFPTTDVR